MWMFGGKAEKVGGEQERTVSHDGEGRDFTESSTTAEISEHQESKGLKRDLWG